MASEVSATNPQISAEEIEIFKQRLSDTNTSVRLGAARELATFSPETLASLLPKDKLPPLTFITTTIIVKKTIVDEKDDICTTHEVTESKSRKALSDESECDLAFYLLENEMLSLEEFFKALPHSLQDKNQYQKKAVQTFPDLANKSDDPKIRKILEDIEQERIENIINVEMDEAFMGATPKLKKCSVRRMALLSSDTHGSFIPGRPRSDSQENLKIMTQTTQALVTQTSNLKQETSESFNFLTLVQNFFKSIAEFFASFSPKNNEPNSVLPPLSLQIKAH